MNNFEMLVKWKMVKNRRNGRLKFLIDLEHAKNMSNLWQHWYGNYATSIKRFTSYGRRRWHTTSRHVTQKYSKLLSLEQIYFSPTLFCSEKDLTVYVLFQSFGESVDMTSSKEKDLEFHFKCVGDKCIPQILHKYQAVMGWKISYCMKFILWIILY